MSEVKDSAELAEERIPLHEFCARLAGDGKRVLIGLDGKSIYLSAEQAFRLAITLQHIAAQARGNGG